MSNHEDIPEAKAAAATKKIAVTSNASQDNPDIPVWATKVFVGLIGAGMVSHSYLWYTSTALDWKWSSWCLCTYAPAVVWSGIVIPQVRKKKIGHNPKVPKVINGVGSTLTLYAMASTYYIWDHSIAVEWRWSHWAMFTWAPILVWASFVPFFENKKQLTIREASLLESSSDPIVKQDRSLPEWVPKVLNALGGYACWSTFYLWDTSTASDWGWGYWSLCTWAPIFVCSIVLPVVFIPVDRPDEPTATEKKKETEETGDATTNAGATDATERGE